MYINEINSILKLNVTNDSPLVLDLFAGCGGLALGFESVGFDTFGYEMNQDACDTYNKNLDGNCQIVKLERGHEFPEADVVIGGPPCQPFSVGGKQAGLRDSRDGFPIFISAVDQVRPKIWMFENVRGMFYKNKKYLLEIIEELRGFGYSISYELLNAKYFNVPQNRERLIVVGHTGGFIFPLVENDLVTTGQALGDMAYEVNESSKLLSPNQDAYIKKYEIASKCVRPRDLHLDRPARTLTCRNLAGATGDMHRIRLPDGRRRRVEVREAARLQSFPDWFEFCGKESSRFKQIGNAVPPMLSRHLAASIMSNINPDFTINRSSSRGPISQQAELF